ncbi:unnamed protein product [Polarella glacialis]|uniref:Uncharacterized protein n=1 Tax=Polarella glacialis TaxID=89957 RepID=A0A813LDV0_POLGL|nr:unnamed protein product [Polarella glacialis]
MAISTDSSRKGPPDIIVPFIILKVTSMIEDPCHSQEMVIRTASRRNYNCQHAGYASPVVVVDAGAANADGDRPKQGLSQTCQRYKEMKAAACSHQYMVVDPLDKYGLSMVEFNRMLAQHEADAAVQQAITVVMGSPPGGMASTEAGQGLTMKKIIEIHSFMLQEFEKLAAQADKGSRDPRTLTFAAQAVVTGKTEAAFSVTPEDIESAVLANHGALDANPEFSAINVKLQQAMAKLMGMA